MRRAVLLLAVLASLTAGCGAQRGNELSDAQGALAKAGTSRIEMTMQEGGKTLYVAKGSFDYENERGQIFVLPTREADDWDLPGENFEGRFFGKTSYFGLELAGKQRWVKQDEENYDPSGSDVFLPGPGGPSPDRVLALLVKSSKEVEVLGKDDIRGVSAKHYRAHVDKNKLPDVAGEPSKLVVDAWIDDDGLVRRLVVPEDDEDGASATTVDLFDFGVTVDVEVPSAEEIITDDEFMKLLEAECKARATTKTKAGEGGFCASTDLEYDSDSGTTTGPVVTVEEPK
jgi:hypothetical protein